MAILAASLFAFPLSAAVAGPVPEPVSTSHDQLEEVSFAGVATAEGELRRPQH